MVAGRYVFSLVTLLALLSLLDARIYKSTQQSSPDPDAPSQDIPPADTHAVDAIPVDVRPVMLIQEDTKAEPKAKANSNPKGEKAKAEPKAESKPAVPAISPPEDQSGPGKLPSGEQRHETAPSASTDTSPPLPSPSDHLGGPDLPHIIDPASLSMGSPVILDPYAPGPHNGWGYYNEFNYPTRLDRPRAYSANEAAPGHGAATSLAIFILFATLMFM